MCTSSVLCQHHLADVLSDEFLAFDHWQSLMKSGAFHYATGCFKDAEMLMKGAFEIAVMRFEIPGAVLFSEFQIEKPLEFLCAIYNKLTAPDAAEIITQKYRACIENSEQQRCLVH